MYFRSNERAESESVAKEIRPAAAMIQSLRFQFVLLLGLWAIPLWLHWGNDGIWFQGDSPRHALNAVFYLDLVKEGLPNPVEYAHQYYVRYPAISPQRYPPLFHLLLAGAFAVFGVSGFLAKTIVQLFALVLGVYTLLGLRRWVSSDAGIVAGLVLLMPGIMKWSGAVMLNVPALALGVACLFHLRCVLERPDSSSDYKQLCLALVFAALSICIHPTVGVVIPIAGLWLLLDRRWRCLLNPRVLAVVVACVVTCGLLYWLLFRMSSAQFSQAAVSNQGLESVLWPRFYLHAIPNLIGWWSIPAVVVGVMWLLMMPRTRKDAIRIVLASLLTLGLLQSIWAKDERYLLWACPAATWLIACALVALSGSRLFGGFRKKVWAIPVVGLIIYSTYYVAITKDKLIKTVNGFTRVAEHVIRVAPGEPVLYHGTYDGTVAFYLRCLDDDLRQQLVMVRKLQLQPDRPAGKPSLQWLADKSRERQQEISRNQKWIAAELRRTGCNWLLLEEPSGGKGEALADLLVTLAESQKYELLEVFNVDMKSRTRRVMLYRIRYQEAQGQGGTKRSLPMQLEGRTYWPVSSR
ncbi:hypothetical protein SV7mr_19100 [Stieleria bergensis]|uniref:Glycosyltransferase RgtA/B/C/D-like domain-containing protein n=2 Tax=Stieleria bergensis TaxID=2528025 RepID=A0A517STI5_9BACT|nr:hypothetical protein SV7mr_19100 [Planctomycetes bacterium SV_7m_r]